VTFDENDGRADNKILTVFAGAGISPVATTSLSTTTGCCTRSRASTSLPARPASAPVTDIWR